MIDRRSLLTGAAASAAAIAGSPLPALAEGLVYGPASPFSFGDLKRRAREMAQAPYVAPARPDPELLWPIDYDVHGAIKFKPSLALWSDGPSDYPVTFFHLGRFFTSPVRMHLIEAGQEREIIYEASYFEMPPDSPARRLPPNSGFAGFRMQESRMGTLDWRSNDWVAFLGASYFRAIGDAYQYGLSARGVAVDTAVAGKNEEFPAFTQIFFEPPQPGSSTLVVYALLDGPSIAGAFRFAMSRERAVLMDVEVSLHLRRDVDRLGIAPLTSMYWFSETLKPTAIDWRPEVHDSDGLALWTGTGERIWRPLNNPGQLSLSSFRDESPRGFGLMQRDRAFDHYLDGVHYDRRPSLWIEPIGDWGRGAVELVEIPTEDEIHDNIVAMWVPAEPARAGQSYEVRYRMHWAAEGPYPAPLARCVATRIGLGGEPGIGRREGGRKFVLEFLGEPLARLPSGVKPQPVVWASRGRFSGLRTEAVPDDVPGHWRAEFDLAVNGTEPVEMRVFLRAGDQVLTETWLNQYHPAL
jgi:glucans biosynthesis protein